jgi:hypothetical protein
LAEKSIDWSYLAGYFDNSGALYEKNGKGRVGEARLRFSSYNRDFLEEVRGLTGGSIVSELHSKGPYYRLTITGYTRVRRVLTILVPFLRRKKLIVKRWLLLHQVDAEIRGLKRRIRLKPGRLVRADIRSLKMQLRQLTPPPP